MIKNKPINILKQFHPHTWIMHHSISNKLLLTAKKGLHGANQD
jgi:hypothetical protein